MFFTVRKLGNRRGLATIIYSIIPKNINSRKSGSKKNLKKGAYKIIYGDE